MRLPSSETASLLADRKIHPPLATLTPSGAIASVRDDKFQRDFMILLNLFAMIQNRQIDLAPLGFVVRDSGVHELLYRRNRHAAVAATETNRNRLRNRVELGDSFIDIALKFAEQLTKVAGRIGPERI